MSPAIQFLTMDVLIDNKKDQTDEDSMQDEIEVPNAEDLVFLYKLVPGKIIPSYGITVASLAGLPNEIIERSKVVAGKLAKSRPIEPIRETEKGATFKAIFQQFTQTDNSDESITKLFHFVRQAIGQ